MELLVKRVKSFHWNDGVKNDNAETKLEIGLSPDMLMLISNGVAQDQCYNDIRCEAATWQRVGFRLKDGIKSDVLKCLRCQKFMLRHIVRE
jgi:hypothetical protein